MPRVVPTWFLYRDHEVLFTPRARSVFLENLRRDPRLGLSVDEDALPYRKVTVQGAERALKTAQAPIVGRQERSIPLSVASSTSPLGVIPRAC